MSRQLGQLPLHRAQEYCACVWGILDELPDAKKQHLEITSHAVVEAAELCGLQH